MDIVIILSILLVITMIAFIPVIVKRPKDVEELQEENGYLKEIIHYRDAEIADLKKLRADEERT